MYNDDHHKRSTYDDSAGFTLVEVLIALALSTLLLYVAIVAFRSTSQSMQVLQRQSAENAVLRAGYHLAMDEVDFWRPECDPAYPYIRAHQSSATSALDVANSLYDFRPMREVAWRRSLTDARNPSGWSVHISHPGSWYRGALLPNVSNGSFRTGYLGIGSSYATVVGYFPDDMSEVTRERLQSNFYKFDPPERKYSPSDINFINAPDPRVYPSLAASFIVRPQGWQLRSVQGDYAMLQNIDGYYLQEANDAESWRHWRSQRMWHVFSHLGITGLYEYGLPGDINLICASSINDRTWNYIARDGMTAKEIRADHNYRLGEVPWSRAGRGSISKRTVNVLAGSRTSTGDYSSYPSAFVSKYSDFFDDGPEPMRSFGTMYNRSNYAHLALSHTDPLRSDFVGQRPWLRLTDFGSRIGYARSTNTVLSGQISTQPLTLFGLMLPPDPPRKSYASSTLVWNNYYAGLQNPIVILDVPESASPLVQDSPDSGEPTRYLSLRVTASPTTNYRTVRDAATLETWHLPSAYTGKGSLLGEQDGNLRYRLVTRQLRYRYGGNRLAETSITLLDPTRSSSQEMRISTLTTSLRGARSYWGMLAHPTDMASPGDGPVKMPNGSAMPLMGDVWRSGP